MPSWHNNENWTQTCEFRVIIMKTHLDLGLNVIACGPCMYREEDTCKKPLEIQSSLVNIDLGENNVELSI